ncbi:MAG: murein L,D-transpeptidase YafK [Myxococcota bacterium]|jgi:murein L,D-transpeptidase YafK
MSMQINAIALVALLTGTLACAEASAGDFLSRQLSKSRVRAAWADQGADVKAMFADAGATWPPSDLFVRAFKTEGELELWAGTGKPNAKLVKVHTFPICAASGDLGPKIRQGDGQVPEGFYVINRFNPRSSYHLSLGLDYPNAVDKARTRTQSRGRSPGGDIFIHGSCVTIGCMPLTDGPMERLYLAAIHARGNGQRRVPVHVFPCRFGTKRCQRAMAEHPALNAFWMGLRPGFDAFERTGRPPRVTAKRSGYHLR